jgi:hypothetical protein
VGKLARRKKDCTFDGADFVISPMTYSQIEEYGLMQKEFREKHKDFIALDPNALLTEEEQEKYQPAVQASRAIAHFVLCAGLNNANEALQLTPQDVVAEMDDGLAGKLIREILLFSGVRIPKQPQLQAPGESPASS